MNALTHPEVAQYQLRPEFEAALDSPQPAVCPHCQRRRAAKLSGTAPQGAHPAGLTARPSTACPKRRHWHVGQYQRYQHAVGSLTPEEKMKLKHIAHAIVRSHVPGCTPVGTVLVIGHADHDPAREQQEPGFLAKISGHRALAVQKAADSPHQ